MSDIGFFYFFKLSLALGGNTISSHEKSLLKLYMILTELHVFGLFT